MRRTVLLVLAAIFGLDAVFIGIGAIISEDNKNVVPVAIVFALIAFFLWRFAGPKQSRSSAPPPVRFEFSDHPIRADHPAKEDTIESLHRENLQCAKLNNWGLYRNNIYSVAEIYKRQGNIDAELEMLIMVNYIDANEPNNLGTDDPSLMREFPPFEPSNAVFAPAPVDRMFRLFQEIGLSNSQAKARFVSVAAKRRIALMPRSPGSAWKAICSFHK